MEVVATSGATRRAKLQSNLHHQQINTKLCTGRMPFLSPNQQCQSTMLKLSLHCAKVIHRHTYDWAVHNVWSMCITIRLWCWIFLHRLSHFIHTRPHLTAIWTDTSSLSHFCLFCVTESAALHLETFDTTTYTFGVIARERSDFAGFTIHITHTHMQRTQRAVAARPATCSDAQSSA